MSPLCYSNVALMPAHGMQIHWRETMEETVREVREGAICRPGEEQTARGDGESCRIKAVSQLNFGPSGGVFGSLVFGYPFYAPLGCN